MADYAAIEIPDRALFKAAEVCELLNVQPYVLRTWEAEFPELGVAKTAGAPRVYRRGDVEQVMRIRHLLLVEGLTLAGARRRIEEAAAPIGANEPILAELLGKNARERLTLVKRGLQALLDLLAAPAGAVAVAGEFKLAAQAVPVQRPSRSPARSSRTPAQGKTGRSKHAASSRRKRSAVK
jgi:DNA-binding transcriptional MerR regulator